jgi:hypothetical protein
MNIRGIIPILLVAACAVLGVGSAPPGPPAAAPAAAAPVTAFEQGCAGIQAGIPVPPENVRPLVPEEFELGLDASGMASIGFGVVRCEKAGIVGTAGQETLEAHVSVAIANPEPPDASDVINAELLNSYHLWIAYDNQDLVEFFRTQAGGAKAVYVPGMVFRLDPDTGELFFEVAEPAPSPFVMTAVVDQPAGPGLDISVNFWASSHEGGQPSQRVQIPVDIDGLRLTGVPEGRVVPAPGSELAQVFCGHDGRFDDPLGLASNGVFFDSTYFADVQPQHELSPTGRPNCVAQQEDCTGVQAVIEVPVENLDPLVPDELAEVEDHLEVVVVRCERFILGRTDHGAMTIVEVSVGITPDDEVPEDQTPNPVLYPDVLGLDDYIVWTASDNEHYIRWLLEQGAMRPRDAVVADLVFTLEPDPSCAASDPALPTLSSRFHFVAPRPSRSPFTMDACFGPAVVGPINFFLDHWAEVPRGLLTVPETFDQFTIGQVSGTLTPDPDTEIARLFCGGSRDFAGASLDPAAENADGLSFTVRHTRYQALVDTTLLMPTGASAECRVEG